jgi:hypothetical protein
MQIITVLKEKHLNHPHHKLNLEKLKANREQELEEGKAKEKLAQMKNLTFMIRMVTMILQRREGTQQTL